MKKKILIVEDHKLISYGLEALIDTLDEVDSVGIADNGRQAIEMTKELKPDIILMDIQMPELNGIEATRMIKEKYPKTKIIALSMYMDRIHVTNILRAGADGYIVKDSPFEILKEGIKAVLNDETYLCSKVSDLVVKDYLETLEEDKSVFNILTEREYEILQMIAEGKSTKNIASEIFVSVKTVETHRKNIMDKLNIYSIAELTKFAIREGITPLEQ